MAAEILCDYCQKPFRAQTFDIKLRQLGLKQSLTCSRECSYAIRRGRPVPKKRNRIDLICNLCGKPFQEKASNASNRRFCSIQCKAEFQKTALRGENNPFFGRKHSQETISRITETRLYQFGDANPNWRGGVTELKKLIRKSKKYQKWRTQVYKRDKYCSVQSGKKGRARELVAHHKIPFIAILREFLALHPDLDPEKDANKLCEIAMKYKPFWDVSNGMTLLRDEHQALHSRNGGIDDND